MTVGTTVRRTIPGASRLPTVFCFIDLLTHAPVPHSPESVSCIPQCSQPDFARTFSHELGNPAGLIAREFSIFDPMRLVGVFAFATPEILQISRVVAIEPMDIAVAFESQDMSRHPVEKPAVM